MRIAAGFACALGWWAQMQAAAAAAPIMYGAIRSELRASAVPVLLPQPIPAALGPIRSVTVIDAGAAGYYVGFSPLAGCGGGLSCAFFHVAGFAGRHSVRGGERGGERIRLPDGTAAAFIPEDCSGAGCTEASLTFARGGAEYEIDVRNGSDDRTILIAAYRALRRLR